jgi:hypothetical protein
MKTVRLTSLLWMITTVSALAANPEWDQATRLYNSGDYRAALSAFRKISDKNPSEPTAHYMLAQCYKNSGNTKQAITELEWITRATNDRRVKGPAEALLAQLNGGGGGVRAATVGQSSSDLILTRGKTVPVMAGQAHIENAISPYSVPPGGFQSGATVTSIASQSTATKAAAAPDFPPSNAISGGSVAQSVSDAARKGWAPCRGQDCLTFAKSGWTHPEGEQFHAENMYMGFTQADGKLQYYSQYHIGHLIKEGKDVGPCPVCKGSGWVKSR